MNQEMGEGAVGPGPSPLASSGPVSNFVGDVMDTLFPLPRPPPLKMISGLSSGCRQRLAKRVKHRHDYIEMISSLNWMHVGDFDAQPTSGPSALQLRVLRRLDELVGQVDYSDLPGGMPSQEAAYKELLHGLDGYCEPSTPASLAPFNLELISLPGDLSTAPAALDLLDGDDRRYLEAELLGPPFGLHARHVGLTGKLLDGQDSSLVNDRSGPAVFPAEGLTGLTEQFTNQNLLLHPGFIVFVKVSDTFFDGSAAQGFCRDDAGAQSRLVTGRWISGELGDEDYLEARWSRPEHIVHLEDVARIGRLCRGRGVCDRTGRQHFQLTERLEKSSEQIKHEKSIKSDQGVSIDSCL
ncbi:unnamed protein product [Durusdinium trenchii]|uniref:Uncharacterized protein n=1 Tax=Durusdinium trenchii TaxID=1381693 RepID=A0ABP0LGC2_9DINO